MNAADFRHGPLELISPDFVSLIFAGSSKTAQHNHNLALDIVRHGGQAIWMDTKLDAEIPTVLIPNIDDFLRPLGEILPMQMLTLVMAVRKNVVAGQFRIVGKITTVE